MQYHHQRAELSREGTIFNARSRSQLKFNWSIVSIGSRTIVKKLTFYVPQKSGERSSSDAGSFGGFGRRRNELLSLIFIVYLFLFFFFFNNCWIVVNPHIIWHIRTMHIYKEYKRTCIHTNTKSMSSTTYIYIQIHENIWYIYIYIHIFTYLSIPKEEERYLNYFIFWAYCACFLILL